jgi:hypothetical protein
VGVRVLHLDGLVPFVGDSFERLRVDVILRLLNPVWVQSVEVTRAVRHYFVIDLLPIALRIHHQNV